MRGKSDRLTFQSRVDEMLKTLRTEILSGERQPGSYLPSEVALGEQYKISKKSVRNVLDILVEEGHIVKIPRVGNRVTVPESDATTTIKLGIYVSVGKQNFLEDLLQQFYKQYPGIRVETVTLPYSNYPFTIKPYLSGGFLDVVMLNNRNYLEMSETDTLHDLEPITPDRGLYSFLTELFSRDGTLHSIPFMFSPVVLCYNKDMFRSCGLTEPNSGWTWDVLLEKAFVIQEQTGSSGFYAHIESLNRFPIFLLQSGYRFIKDSTGYRYDDPALWEILRLCRSLLHDQGFLPAFLSEGDGAAEKLFSQQKTAMIMTTYYNLKMVENVPFQYDITPLPYTKIPKTLLLATGLAINRFSKQKEAARLLVDFLVSEASQRFVQQRTLSLPARISVAEQFAEEGLSGPSRYHLYREIVPTFANYKELNINMGELDAFTQELKPYWAGLDEPEAVIERMQRLHVPVK